MANFINTYFNFDYKIGFLLGVVLFLLYLKIPRISENKKITLDEVVKGVLLCFYLVMLFGVTLLNRTPEEHIRMDLELFWSYKKTFRESDILLGKQIFYNILALVPWGILIPAIYENMRSWKKVVFSGMVLSIFIEGSQLIFRCGLCELDDVMNNTLGAAIGYMLFTFIIKKRCPRYD